VSVGKSRGFLYRLTRLLGDYQAASSGNPEKIARRVGRRAAGKAIGESVQEAVQHGSGK